MKPKSKCLFQNIDSARDYFKRKVTFVTEQMGKIQAIGLEKSKIREGKKSFLVI